MTTLQYGPMVKQLALQEALASSNQHHTTIKSTATWSTEEVTFLNMRAYKDHRVKMGIYATPTDECSYRPNSVSFQCLLQ